MSHSRSSSLSSASCCSGASAYASSSLLNYGLDLDPAAPETPRPDSPSWATLQHMDAIGDSFVESYEESSRKSLRQRPLTIDRIKEEWRKGFFFGEKEGAIDDDETQPHTIEDHGDHDSFEDATLSTDATSSLLTPGDCSDATSSLGHHHHHQDEIVDCYFDREPAPEHPRSSPQDNAVAWWEDDQVTGTSPHLDQPTRTLKRYTRSDETHGNSPNNLLDAFPSVPGGHVYYTGRTKGLHPGILADDQRATARPGTSDLKVHDAGEATRRGLYQSKSASCLAPTLRHSQSTNVENPSPLFDTRPLLLARPVKKRQKSSGSTSSSDVPPCPSAGSLAEYKFRKPSTDSPSFELGGVRDVHAGPRSTTTPTNPPSRSPIFPAGRRYHYTKPHHLAVGIKDVHETSLGKPTLLFHHPTATFSTPTIDHFRGLTPTASSEDVGKMGKIKKRSSRIGMFVGKVLHSMGGGSLGSHPPPIPGSPRR